MNNPFLSDRNIFSKVTNPIKKKSQTQKKQELKKPQPYVKPNQTNRQSFVNNYDYYNQQKKLQNQYNKPGNAQHKFIPTQKMTFGVPNQESNGNIDNFNIKNNVKPQTYTNTQFNYSKPSVQSNHKSNTLDNFYSQNRIKGGAKTNFQENNSLASATHQDYPKSSNFDDYSPIIPKTSAKLNQSQFINIQAFGDDLNKFLAQSKNQDQLCKILGIQKKPREKIIQNKTSFQVKRQQQLYKNNQNRSYQPVNHQKLTNPFTKPSLNYQKQRVLEASSSNNVFQSFKPKVKTQQQSQKSSKEYIPTFNYVGVQNEVLTESIQQEVLPRFNKIKEKQLNRHQQALEYQPLEPQQNLEVFNYSKINTEKTQASLQDIINKQMMSLALSGKYRTFLTSSQKLVMIKYKAEHL